MFQQATDQEPQTLTSGGGGGKVGGVITSYKAKQATVVWVCGDIQPSHRKSDHLQVFQVQPWGFRIQTKHFLSLNLSRA